MRSIKKVNPNVKVQMPNKCRNSNVWNRGMLEWWNNDKMKGNYFLKIPIIPIFHSSTIPYSFDF